MRGYIGFLLLFLSIITYSQKKIEVSVNVSASELIENQITYMVKKELRSIPDIDVVDFSYVCDISIVVVKGSYYSSALNVSSHRSIIDAWIEYSSLNNIMNLPYVDIDAFSDSLLLEKNDYYLQKQLKYEELISLRTMTDSDLESLCKRIVANIDVDVLEDFR